MTLNTILPESLDTSVSSKLSGFKNVIIGGDFGTNPWQRGISFVSPATDTYQADRWLFQYSGAVVTTINTNADAPTVAQAGYFTNLSHQIQITTADTSIAAGDFCILTQHVEGYNFRPLAQQPFTLSFWVKAYKPGIYCVAFSNSIADRTYVAEYTINQSATWEKKTITVSASPTAGTWNYTNGTGLMVRFTLAAGTNYQTTAGSWNVVTALATANQVNGVDSTSNYFNLALVQLEAGTKATPFEQRSVQQELQLCQRYYETGRFDQRQYLVWGYSATSHCGYAVTKRAGATVTLNVIDTQNVASLAVYHSFVKEFSIQISQTNGFSGGCNTEFYYYANAEL